MLRWMVHFGLGVVCWSVWGTSDSLVELLGGFFAMSVTMLRPTSSYIPVIYASIEHTTRETLE
jgi:hypothetical protein